jgi:hypothetical protein
MAYKGHFKPKIRQPEYTAQMAEKKKENIDNIYREIS